MFGRLTGIVAGLVMAGGLAAQDQAEVPDLLTLASGAVLVSATVDPVTALALTDGDPGSNWSASTKKFPPPYSFVFELIAPATLTAVGLHGAGPRPGGVQGGSAGFVSVAGSNEGPDQGYQDLARFKAASDGVTLAEISPDTPIRWLRFTVEGGQTPDVSWIYFSEAIAHGTVAPPNDPDRFTGVFQSGRKDFIELHQDGDFLSGCYLENSGLSTGRLSGAVRSGVALLSWTSDQGIVGTAFLTRDSTGALTGAKYRHRSRKVWGGPVAPEGTTTPCSPESVAAETPEVPVDPIVKALEDLGEVRIYGIHFEYDSDVPKPSALPALQRLQAALQSAPTLNVDIEGHTDADGADGYNQDLSDRRAAVVAWLVDNGVDAARLGAVGKGESTPVASNTTADGKALNRRVEVRRR